MQNQWNINGYGGYSYPIYGQYNQVPWGMNAYDEYGYPSIDSSYQNYVVDRRYNMHKSPNLRNYDFANIHGFHGSTPVYSGVRAMYLNTPVLYSNEDWQKNNVGNYDCGSRKNCFRHYKNCSSKGGCFRQNVRSLDTSTSTVRSWSQRTGNPFIQTYYPAIYGGKRDYDYSSYADGYDYALPFNYGGDDDVYGRTVEGHDSKNTDSGTSDSKQHSVLETPRSDGNGSPKESANTAPENQEEGLESFSRNDDPESQTSGEKERPTKEHPDLDSRRERRAAGAWLTIGLCFGAALLAFLLASVGVYYWFYGRRKSTRRMRLHNRIFSQNHLNVYQRESEAKRNYDPWKMPKSFVDIDYNKKLGAGAFCSVYKGTIFGEAPICKTNPSASAARLFRNCECAVKVLPAFANDVARSDFLQEINFMKSLRYHAHMVSMLGWVDDEKSPMLLVEYCQQGDLLHLLRTKKEEIITGYENSNVLKIRHLVSFSWQISNGLEYLSNVGCIHRDIAARNVFVDDSNVAKIGDFGLCRLSDCLLYTGRGGGRLPLKWMAPESLESFEYSHKSDVWSYGVLLYEIFSFGEVPYPSMQTPDLLGFLKAGKRLNRPDYCPRNLYVMMLKCWEMEPEQRPTFSSICTSLRTILETATENYGYIAAVNHSRMPSAGRS